MARPELRFAFRLALRLGMTVERLLDEMSSNEFLLWQAFDAECPVGDERMDADCAVIAATLANINRDTKRRPEPFSVRDFMLFLPREEKDPQVELSKRARLALLNTGR